MSGGHFDYGCFAISRFAEELQHEIEINDDETENQYGDRIGAGFSDFTMERIRTAHKIIETAGKLAKEIEWLYSGDHGEESYLELTDRILGGVECNGPAITSRATEQRNRPHSFIRGLS